MTPNPQLPAPPSPAARPATSTGEARVLSLINAMERLMALYREETALLQTRNIKAMLTLVERKHLLTKGYDDAVRIISLDLPTLKALEPDLKSRLKQVADAFREESAANAVALRAATSVAQSVVNIMVNAINKQRAAETGYTARRGSPYPAGYRKGGIPPLALNQCL